MTHVHRRVSVIIPTYNYGDFIEDAIKSTLAQKIEDLEIIVVDDGSTDDTAAKIRKYSSKVKYIYQKNSGQAAARNTGILNSTGEFIQFLDSDDILGPGKIIGQIRYLKANPQARVAVCPNRFFRTLAPGGRPKLRGFWRLFKKNLDIHLCYFNIAPPHAFLFRREVISRVGNFDSSVDNCEDYDFVLRAAFNGYTPHFTDSSVVYYRRHKKSVTAFASRQYLTDFAMHKKLSVYLEQFNDFPQGHRVEGLFAFAAGAVKTAERLWRYHPEKSCELLQLVLKKIESAKRMVDLKMVEWNFPMKVYSLKLISAIVSPDIVDIPSANAIKKNFFEILRIINAPQSINHLIASIFLSSFSVSRQCDQEKILLAYLPIKYILNRLLPVTGSFSLLK